MSTTTATTRTPQPFAVQMKNFFGLKEGQASVSGPGSFISELKALDDKDKAEFTAMLNEAGYPVKPAETKATA